MNGNCGVCGQKGMHICPEHGERCDEHAMTHAFCPQLRRMCVSCWGPVPEGTPRYALDGETFDFCGTCDHLPYGARREHVTPGGT